MKCPKCNEEMATGMDIFRRKITICFPCAVKSRYMEKKCKVCKRLESFCLKTRDNLMQVGRWKVCRRCFVEAYEAARKRRD